MKMRDEFTDEIGLHIHPYCHFVESAGLTCITDQSTTMARTDRLHDQASAPTTAQQFGTLLDARDDAVRAERPEPPEDVPRRRLDRDARDARRARRQGLHRRHQSALNWARIEEWSERGELYRWNMENWAPIGDTSQPYYPSETDVLTSAAPTMAILEVPDNGVMIDYVSLAEMNGMFDANWNGQPLSAPSTLMMGFHPAPSIRAGEYERVDGFLDVRRSCATRSKDLGPGRLHHARRSRRRVPPVTHFGSFDIVSEVVCVQSASADLIFTQRDGDEPNE